MLEKIGIYAIQEGKDYDRNGIGPRSFSIFKDLCEIVNPKIVLEIGSWEGASALSWLNNMSDDSKLICIDTWLGSFEHYLSPGNHEWGSDRLFFEDGYPSIYKTFVSNIRNNEFYNRVYALPIDSRQGLMLIKECKVVPDICYIDAAHDYDSVYEDVSSSYALGGRVVCGDDYYLDISKQIKKAVDDFAKTKNIPVLHKESQFVISKEEEIRNRLVERGWQ